MRIADCELRKTKSFLMTNKTQKNFDEQAPHYDETVLKLVPKYVEQNQFLLKLIPFNSSDEIRVLDLGCGTGILAYLILQQFPKAQIKAFDLAQNMIDQCKELLIDFSGRVEFQQGDFLKDDFGNGYDLIVSGLAMHHSTHEEKEQIYQKIFNALNAGGIFINRDIVIGETEALTQLYQQHWQEFVASNGEDPEHWLKRHLEYDQPSSLSDQLSWLKKAGFEDVDCFWKYYNYTIFGGKKGSGFK